MASFTENIPPSVLEWLDPALLPVYGIVGVAVFLAGRYIDNTFIRPPSKTGFGKGAPGFITNTRQIRVTPEIAARLRRGEQVSPEEISAAVKAAEEAQAAAATTSGEEPVSEAPVPKKKGKKEAKRKAVKQRPPPKVEEPPSEPVNEWIPDVHIKKPGGQRKRRG